MQIAFHLGLHCTDEDRLLRSLLQNAAKLSPLGISVPGPGRYRDTFVKAAEKLRGEPASEETQAFLLESVLDRDDARRLILSHENFICMPSWVFEAGRFYARAAYKPLWYRNLFPDHEVEFFLAIRNPATLLPDLIRHKWQSHDDYASLLQGAQVDHLRWPQVIEMIHNNVPDAKLTVWSNEDTPFIWPEILGAVAGTSPDVPLKGGLHVASRIIDQEGYRRLRTYLINHPPTSDAARHKIISVFIEKYGIPEAIEEAVDFPGATEDLVAAITEQYEADLDVIGDMDGVRLIST